MSEQDFAFEHVPASRLNFMPNNPNSHDESQIAALARSIRLWGIPIPIIVDESYTVLAGNGTLEAAVKAGCDSIPVRVVSGWTEQMKREYAVLDNKLRQMSCWDEGVLKETLSGLLDTDFLDGIGYSGQEIDDMLADTVSFSAGGDESSTGMQVIRSKFGGETVPMSSDEYGRVMSFAENHRLARGTAEGIVSSLLDSFAQSLDP